jgi:hypothetical protein
MLHTNPTPARNALNPNASHVYRCAWTPAPTPAQLRARMLQRMAQRLLLADDPNAHRAVQLLAAAL